MFNPCAHEKLMRQKSELKHNTLTAQNVAIRHALPQCGGDVKKAKSQKEVMSHEPMLLFRMLMNRMLPSTGTTF